jgi:two-component system, cell cycle sensor histidine kinase and response regulator CckA
VDQGRSEDQSSGVSVVWVSGVAGAAAGLLLLHTSAALFIGYGEGLGIVASLRDAFGATAAPLLAFHVVLGGVVGLASGLASRTFTRRRLEQERHAQMLREQLLQAQKLESLGRLAGGLAHDVNNVLSALNTTLHLASRTLDTPAEAARHMQEARAVSQKAGRLTAKLLAFARAEPGTPVEVDPNALVAEARPLLKASLGSGVGYSERLSSTLRVLVDPTQFEQVLLNLVVNARDAMGESGRIEVTTRDAQRAGGGPPTVAEGAYVVLEVTDTGPGIPPEVRSRLFEPFFTTKPKGQGTGLGLSTVWGIVLQAGGTVEVTSAPGEGTTFQVWWPAITP